MFYRIVVLFGVVAGLLIVPATFAAMDAIGGAYMMIPIALYLPAGIINILHWLFKGEGFFGNNKALTFIFMLIPHVLNIIIGYLTLTGSLF